MTLVDPDGDKLILAPVYSRELHQADRWLFVRVCQDMGRLEAAMDLSREQTIELIDYLLEQLLVEDPV